MGRIIFTGCALSLSRKYIFLDDNIYGSFWKWRDLTAFATVTVLRPLVHANLSFCLSVCPVCLLGCKSQGSKKMDCVPKLFGGSLGCVLLTVESGVGREILQAFGIYKNIRCMWFKEEELSVSPPPPTTFPSCPGLWASTHCSA